MEVTGVAVRIDDRSGVGDARRKAADLTRSMGLDEPSAGRVALAVVELAANAYKHARDGWMFLSPCADPVCPAVDLVVFDRGGGIPDVGRAMGDGYSTAGTPGTGIGAVIRQSVAFDLFTEPGRGTVVSARVGPDPARVSATSPGERIDVWAFVVPKAGQDVSGDAWSVRHLDGTVQMLVADGLGHGPEAHRAGRKAVEVFQASRAVKPVPLLEELHRKLRPTRGAAVAVLQVEPGHRLLRFAGIGNIAARLVTEARAQGLVSVNGTAGHVARTLREFEYEAPSGALVVMHSDGIATRWDLGEYPGLTAKSPGVVAGVLLRDFARGRDDMAVLVTRVPEGGGEA